MSKDCIKRDLLTMEECLMQITRFAARDLITIHEIGIDEKSFTELKKDVGASIDQESIMFAGANSWFKVTQGKVQTGNSI